MSDIEDASKPASSSSQASSAAGSQPQVVFRTGQTVPTPPPADPLRVFYESLFRQHPSSQMAMKWCACT
jgi:hypothetical protein